MAVILIYFAFITLISWKSTKMRNNFYKQYSIILAILFLFNNVGDYTFINKASAEPMFGCTSRLYKWKKDYQKVKYSAFAKGKAFTVTGMFGCGYSYGQKTQKAANTLALKRCQEWARNPKKCYISHITK